MHTILAIDLGKYKSVCCSYDVTTKVSTFETISTTPDDIRTVIERHPGDTVVIEACSPAGWVHDLCSSLNVPCVVANTNGEAWQWKRVKRKTDKDDALKLARMYSIGELDAVRVQPKAIRQWKSLIGLRKRLVGERGRGQNRMRGLLLSQGLPAPRGNRAWTELGLKGLELQAKPLSECGPEELWRGELSLLIRRHRELVSQIGEVELKLDGLSKSDKSVSLLLSAPGVGPRTAEVVATHIPEPRRFRTADEVSAYAGLVPRQYQSGETDRRGRITKRGSKILRSALVECAWCSLRYNAWALGVWQRLRGNGLSKKKAVVALARKLLVRLWGLLKSGKPWVDPSPSLAAGPLSG